MNIIINQFFIKKTYKQFFIKNLQAIFYKKTHVIILTYSKRSSKLKLSELISFISSGINGKLYNLAFL